MSLRLGLALRLTLVAIPLLVVFAWLRADFVLRTEVAACVEFGLQHMENGGLERLEEGPSFPGRGSGRREGPRVGPRRGAGPPRGFDEGPEGRQRTGPPGSNRGEGGRPERRRRESGPLRVFSYQANFQPTGPPQEIPPKIRDELEAGAEQAYQTRREEHGWILEVATASPWPDSPAAYLMVVRPLPESIGDWRNSLLPSMPPMLGLILAVFFVANPLVARVRSLTRSVRQSAGQQYKEPVPEEGSDELTQLARAFNEAGTEIRTYIGDIEEREASLRRFLENTSHDVALPLTVLQGQLAQLKAEHQAGDPTSPETLQSALEETHYLTALITNLGVIARVEGHAAPLQNNPVDLGRLVERVTARERVLGRLRQIQVEEALPQAPCFALGDEVLLEQALSNLVHNAVSHGEVGGHVTLVLGRGEEGFRLCVMDDGPGVPEEELEKIAERGWRGSEARERQTQGRGLGLAIALEVVRRHHFELRFRRLEPCGFEACITGPLMDSSGNA